MNTAIPKKFFRETYLPWLVVLFCELIFAGFVSSRALISIGMAGLVLCAFLTRNPIQVLKRYFQSKPLLILSLFFLIVLASGIYSDNKESWLDWVRIKIPYIVLPLAFAGLSRLDEKKFAAILYAFILTFFVSVAVILTNYFLHYDEITESFLRGHAMPIPFSHIRYTLMLAFSFFCCLFLIGKNLYLFHASEKWLQAILAGCIFIALHILSVRSGLLALYLSLFFLSFYAIIKTRKIVVGSMLLAVIVATPILAYWYVPSFHNKISYMRYDLQRFAEGDVNDKSDAIRLVSMQVGFYTWTKNVWIGIGAGDIQQETREVYGEFFGEVSEPNKKLPHNQFVWVMATTGIIGLVLFLLAFLVPLFSNGLYKHWPVAVFHLILFSSFFTEHTLEEQIGTGFYVIFLLLLMNYFTPDE